MFDLDFTTAAQRPILIFNVLYYNNYNLYFTREIIDVHNIWVKWKCNEINAKYPFYKHNDCGGDVEFEFIAVNVFFKYTSMIVLWCSLNTTLCGFI